MKYVELPRHTNNPGPPIGFYVLTTKEVFEKDVARIAYPLAYGIYLGHRPSVEEMEAIVRIPGMYEANLPGWWVSKVKREGNQQQDWIDQFVWYCAPGDYFGQPLNLWAYLWEDVRIMILQKLVEGDG